MAMLAGATVAGCAKPPCGVLADPGYTNDAGVFTFAPIAAGQAEVLGIPIVDSVDASETLTGAHFSGTDAAAFTMQSTFPMAMPAGTSVDVQVRFAPLHAGMSSGQLILDTAGMGPSPIALEGMTP